MITVRIAGGGPAGIAAAIFAARSGARVIVHEKNDACGVKLLATGGGHCNIGNLGPMEEWPGLFGGRGRFIVPAIGHLPTERSRAWLDGIGIPTATPDGARLYPESGSAAQVRTALVTEALRLGVAIMTQSRVDRLALSPDKTVSGLVVAGEALSADRVILACGGKSFPGSGSSGDGFRIARDAGHAIVTPVPGLVGLKAKGWNSELSGLTLPETRTVFRTKGRAASTGGGELLLTHNGVSGPAVLDLSGAVAEALEQNPGAARTLEIAWNGDASADDWRRRFAAWRAARAKSRVDALIGETLPRKLARWLCAKAGIGGESTAGSLSSAKAEGLAALLARHPLEVFATEGWDRAMITRGGVDLREIDPKTLQSRIIPGLHFAGEVVDVDGPCGGYNLQWAFSSGALAGAACGGHSFH